LVTSSSSQSKLPTLSPSYTISITSSVSIRSSGSNSNTQSSISSSNSIFSTIATVYPTQNSTYSVTPSSSRIIYYYPYNIPVNDASKLNNIQIIQSLEQSIETQIIQQTNIVPINVIVSTKNNTACNINTQLPINNFYVCVTTSSIINWNMPSSILSNIEAIINPSTPPSPQNSSDNNNTTLISVSIISIIIIGGLIALSAYIVRRNRKIKKEIKILKTQVTKPRKVKVIRRKKNIQIENNDQYLKEENIEKYQYVDDEQEKQKVKEEEINNPMRDLPIDQNKSIKISPQLKPIEHSIGSISNSFEPTSIKSVKFISSSLRLPSERSLNVNPSASVLPVNLRHSLSQKFEVKPVQIRTNTNYTPLTKPNFLPTQSISKLIINKPENKTSVKNLISKFEILPQ
jgi:hypothetical protein